MPLATPLSTETEKRLAVLFAPEHREAARAVLIDQCGNNLPFLQDLDAVGLERFRFAALKLSAGKIDELRSWVDLAKIDWRDLLKAAAFDRDIHAHKLWRPGGLFKWQIQRVLRPFASPYRVTRQSA